MLPGRCRRSWRTDYSPRPPRATPVEASWECLCKVRTWERLRWTRLIGNLDLKAAGGKVRVLQEWWTSSLSLVYRLKIRVFNVCETHWHDTSIFKMVWCHFYNLLRCFSFLGQKLTQLLVEWLSQQLRGGARLRSPLVLWRLGLPLKGPWGALADKEIKCSAICQGDKAATPVSAGTLSQVSSTCPIGAQISAEGPSSDQSPESDEWVIHKHALRVVTCTTTQRF